MSRYIFCVWIMQGIVTLQQKNLKFLFLISRGCCGRCGVSHILLTSLLRKVYKWKKVVKVGKGTKWQCGTAAVIEEVQTAVDDVIVEEGDDLTSDKEEIADTLREDDVDVHTDDGQQVHDEKVVQTLNICTIADMAKRGIKITPTQNKAAISILSNECTYNDFDRI